MDDSSTSPRLNLFAFPSLTTLLFALIAGVILVATAVGLAQNLSELGLLIAAGMVVLPLRDFLRQPEQTLRSLGWLPRKADPPPSPLVQDIQEATRDLGLGNPPRLLVTPQLVAPTTLGTWRRRYLVLGSSQAECLTRLLPSMRRALWLHEVAHFANGDHWKVELARSLLRVSIVFMAWSVFFLLGVVILALVYGFEMFEPGYLDTVPLDPSLHDLLTAIWPDPALTAPMLEKARAIHPGLAALYVLNVHLPFVLSGIVLLLFVWRLLVQVREFYADARVAVHMESAKTARSALNEAATELALVPATAPSRVRQQWAKLRQWFDRRMPFHPSWEARFACLEDPLQVFGSWKRAGFIAGLTVLLLDLILVGPFTLGYVSAWPAHFATLAGFVILALWLLPGVCQGFVSTGHMVRQIVGALVVFMGLRAGWLLLNTMLLLALLVLDPALARTLLNATVLLSGKVLTPIPLSLPEDPAMLALLAIAGGWSFTVLVSGSLFITLLLAGVLLRRMLTWYAFPTANRWLIRVGLSVPLILMLILGLVVLPLPTALIQDDLTSLWQPVPLMVAGIASLITVLWGLWFVLTDRRFGQRCPCCGGKVPGWFELGKKCPVSGCEKNLHPWLLANY